MLRLTLEVKTFSRLLLLAMLGISTILSWAESLRDPTQIPAGMIASEGGTNNSSASPQNNGPILQSVMLGAQYRAAIINGKKVKLGEKYEQATLVALSEDSATLRSPDGTKLTLKMLDEAIKKTSAKTMAKTTVKMSFYPPKHAIIPLENAVKTDASQLISSDNNPNDRMK